jgi:hypothetical protein
MNQEEFLKGFAHHVKLLRKEVPPLTWATFAEYYFIYKKSKFLRGKMISIIKKMKGYENV